MLEMIHLYIYFKQESKKKSLLFFCDAFGKTQLEELLKEECLFQWHIGKKNILGCFWNYLIKGCHQEMLKYLFPALVFNLLIRWNDSV
jgi:hypothetical protein